MQNCDKAMVEDFDYSSLSPAFAKLSKPAKRALINNRIYSPKDLARWTLQAVAELHGIGPSSIPILEDTLRKHDLKFKK